jgi:hypothetical protein
MESKEGVIVTPKLKAFLEIVGVGKTTIGILLIPLMILYANSTNFVFSAYASGDLNAVECSILSTLFIGIEIVIWIYWGYYLDLVLRWNIKVTEALEDADYGKPE